MAAPALGRLILRADAGRRIGTGHVMRCLALAQAWRAAGGEALLLGACEPDLVRRRVEATGVGFRALARPHPDRGDLEQTLAAAADAAWVVLDGYHFDPAYQAAVRKAGRRSLVIDDVAHWARYHADLLLNQNVTADALAYDCDADTRVLRGPRFALLRPEFLAARRERSIPDQGRSVLITLGGADPDGATLAMVRALDAVDVPGLEGRVVVGPANPHGDPIEQAARMSRHRVEVLGNALDMPGLMAWADVAIAAAGSTCWELAFMGVPSLLLVTADNQRPSAERLAALGVAENLGRPGEREPAAMAHALAGLLLAAGHRADMARKGQALVDGGGAARVVAAMRGRGLTLRPVRESDCELLWSWVNDPAVRRSAFRSEPIPFGEHAAWLAARLRDPACMHFLASDDAGAPVGQVRFDLGDGEAEVDVSVAADRQGVGYGALLIRQGVTRLVETTRVRLVHAFVKPENVASLRAFRSAGFHECGVEKVRGCDAVHLEWRRDV